MEFIEASTKFYDTCKLYGIQDKVKISGMVHDELILDIDDSVNFQVLEEVLSTFYNECIPKLEEHDPFVTQTVEENIFDPNVIKETNLVGNPGAGLDSNHTLGIRNPCIHWEMPKNVKVSPENSEHNNNISIDELWENLFHKDKE